MPSGFIISNHGKILHIPWFVRRYSYIKIDRRKIKVLRWQSMTEHMSHMSTSNLGHFVIWRRCGLSCEDLCSYICPVSPLSDIKNL